MTKAKLIRSPKGVAVWPFIKQPQTQFNPDGTYKVDLQVDPALPEVAAWLKTIKEEVPEGGKAPFAVADDGTVIVKFRSDYAPKVYDASSRVYKDADEIPSIGGGTECRVAYTAKAWSVSGTTGLKLYLQGFQILQLVEFENSVFEEEEGYVEPQPNGDGVEPMPF